MALIAHHRFLAQEARALLTRLARIRPFVLHETMVPAAALPLAAQGAIERHLLLAKRELGARVRAFLAWLECPTGQAATPEEAQRRFTFLRLRFNALLAQVDIFADVLTQRSEHETGVWLAGLDALAADALHLPGGYYDPPPLVCYVDRGHGAAIRRARTRLPGGSENPVAVIRVPRERMVGSGIASSLVHEVGHQAVSLLDLMASLQTVLAGLQAGSTSDALAWRLLSRWLSEILADFWAVARVGIAAPMGLMAVVSLPRVFVFRISLDDPHPFPWIRVKIACAFGRALWPEPQWDGLARLWESFYPRDGLDSMRARVIALLEATIPAFVRLVIHHRPRALRGASLAEALRVQDRSPERLRKLWTAWGRTSSLAPRTAPSLALAVLGQARADGVLPSEREGGDTARLLTAWALRAALTYPAPSRLQPSVASPQIIKELIHA
jgi:hypothetical protein